MYSKSPRIKSININITAMYSFFVGLSDEIWACEKAKANPMSIKGISNTLFMTLEVGRNIFSLAISPLKMWVLPIIRKKISETCRSVRKMSFVFIVFSAVSTDF